MTLFQRIIEARAALAHVLIHPQFKAAVEDAVRQDNVNADEDTQHEGMHPDDCDPHPTSYDWIEALEHAQQLLKDVALMIPPQ